MYMGMKHKHCGTCSNCKKEDCGVCVFCKDKPKFGGPNRKKQCCKYRKCLQVCNCYHLAILYMVEETMAN